MYDFSKVPKELHQELKEHFDNRDFVEVKNLVVQYKVMGSCGNCAYSNSDCAEWLENFIYGENKENDTG